ncbi:uncharacterized protein LOC129301227, partial [Prosopis cineraria]|uniref:uncharacterized protein LOC129301227 n=1 Tax=Prosopis cineraria TaxID=364024 RepID=UPI00240F4FCF
MVSSLRTMKTIVKPARETRMRLPFYLLPSSFNFHITKQTRPIGLREDGDAAKTFPSRARETSGDGWQVQVFVPECWRYSRMDPRHRYSRMDPRHHRLIVPYIFLINAHVVDFFKDRLWENVDEEWIDCLRRESVENLLLIPSGVIQEHWPTSLKVFILKLQSMVLHREQADMQAISPSMQMTSLNSVLAHGMNLKKKHEVEILSAVVSSIANSVRAHTIIDVGAGQGYLAQVLSFHYQHSVVAIDACSHHGSVTDARAERIKKYYASQMRKSG